MIYKGLNDLPGVECLPGGAHAFPKVINHAEFVRRHEAKNSSDQILPKIMLDSVCCIDFTSIKISKC